MKPATSHSNPTYDWAIRTYYYSSKRLSLRAAYEMMLIEKYTDKEGNLCEGAPGWSGFQHYFYRHAYHKRPEKLIAREGLSNYQRNHRKLSGTASEWRSEIGCFQMDATQADLYLVSRLDRSSVIGRPNIYLAVDTATRLIAGSISAWRPGKGLSWRVWPMRQRTRSLSAPGMALRLHRRNGPVTMFPRKWLQIRGGNLPESG